MRRRSLLRLLAASAGALPFRPWHAWAQTVTFPGTQKATLESLAFIVLPTSLGHDGILQQVTKFEHWVQDYRPGADTDHGYGHTHVIPLPASPAPVYLAQLQELQPALTSGDPQKARTAVLESLSKADVRDLTPLPRGRSVVADLMSLYFHSDEASDLCYQAAIERYKCRGNEHSEQAPASLTKSS